MEMEFRGPLTGCGGLLSGSILLPPGQRAGKRLQRGGAICRVGDSGLLWVKFAPNLGFGKASVATTNFGNFQIFPPKLPHQSPSLSRAARLPSFRFISLELLCAPFFVNGTLHNGLPQPPDVRFHLSSCQRSSRVRVIPGRKVGHGAHACGLPTKHETDLLTLTVPT
jgi:hypothetical protein